ncbi:MAG: PTS sugar transporter subunit IIA [Calditrichaeota bacterium]|nr:PTS sugar transporter subunit IIA [Calditrichota bacterium]
MMKKIADVLTADSVKVPLSGSNREEVLKELLEILSTKSIFKDKNEIYKAVVERERIMTTGVGNGIAIPHCKHDSCKDFRIALGITEEDIEFQAVDQHPVHIIFLLVGPNNSAGMHIKLLSRITRLLSKVEIRQQLLESKSPQEAFDCIIEEEQRQFG